MSFSRIATAALSLALGAGIASPVGAAKGIGPYYSIKYNSLGTSEFIRSGDGKVVLYLEDIETINCSGCDTVLLAPGTLIHLKNVSREPICARVEFTPVKPNYGLEKFGSGAVVHIKGGKMAKQVAGLFYINGGQTGKANTAMDLKLAVWAPFSKGQCSRSAA